MFYLEKNDQRNGQMILKVQIEAILRDHECMIHSIAWHPIKNQLLSVSEDKCLVIWEPVEVGNKNNSDLLDSGIWLEKVFFSFFQSRLSKIGKFLA